MATIWASLNHPFFISQSSGSESYAFLYSLLALDSGKRTEQERATKAKARRGSAERTAQQQVLLKQCVLRFRPAYSWPERWCQRSDWQLSLVDVQTFYERWAPQLTDLSHAARQRVLDALHEKNRRLFSKRFPGVTPGPQRPAKLKKLAAKSPYPSYSIK